MIFKKIWNDQWKLFTAAVLLMWLNVYMVQRFYFHLKISSWFQEIIMFINPLGSTLLLIGIGCLIFRKKQHWVLIGAAMLSSSILFANLLFYRFYNDFITIPVLFQTRNASGLGSSVWALLHWYDLLIFTNVVIIAMLVFKFKWPRFTLVKRPLRRVFLVMVAMFMLNWTLAEIARPELLSRSFDRPLIVKNIGAINYHLYDLFVNSKMESRRVFADSTDMNKAQQYLAAQKSTEQHSPQFGAAKGKNVFLISMESLQNFVIGMRMNGDEVTPFLNTLIEDSSYYFDNLYHQTGQGKTSDAEFILDNSLYPLPSGAVYFTHTQNTFLSTPMILGKQGYHNAVFHANDHTFWNRDIMYDTMGYDEYYSKEFYEINEDNSVGWGLKDEAFFEQLMPMAMQLPQPFYAKVITLTNHFPFEYEEEDELIQPFDSGDESVDRYFVTARYLDEALKRFFELVKEAGLYENSIFVLYGDHYGISNNHKVAMSKLFDKEITPFDEVQLQKVPVIIHVPGVEAETIHSVSGQIDVRPTLLHLLGISEGDDLSFGHDLMDPNRPSFVVMRDGSFVTDEVVFKEDTCYSKFDGNIVDATFCDPYMDNVVEELNYSDQIIYGDLFRFLLDGERDRSGE